MSNVEGLLATLASGDAAGLFLKAGDRPVWRAGGVLVAKGDALPEGGAFHDLLLDLTAKAGCLHRFHDEDDVGFAYAHEGRRYRIHIWREEGGHALFATLLADRAPALEETGFDKALAEAFRLECGLVLLAGPPGSGRTTTVAALLGAINEHHQRHIVSIERTPGFVLEPRRSVVEQIVVGTNAPCAAAAVAFALSAGADVIAVDTVENGDDLRMAIEAAEAGALVYVVGEGYDLADSLDRLQGLLPPDDAGMLRSRLAAQLRLVSCQHRIPARAGRYAFAAEVLPGSQELQAIVRELRLRDLASVGDRRPRGAHSFEQSLADLVHAGSLDRPAAQALARNPARLEALLPR